MTPALYLAGFAISALVTMVLSGGAFYFLLARKMVTREDMDHSSLWARERENVIGRIGRVEKDEEIIFRDLHEMRTSIQGLHLAQADMNGDLKVVRTLMEQQSREQGE